MKTTDIKKPLGIDNRHYCIKCGKKRLEKFMAIAEKRLHRTKWECINCNPKQY